MNRSVSTDNPTLSVHKWGPVLALCFLFFAGPAFGQNEAAAEEGSETNLLGKTFIEVIQGAIEDLVGPAVMGPVPDPSEANAALSEIYLTILLMWDVLGDTYFDVQDGQIVDLEGNPILGPVPDPT
ncbi:MAG: hypothetical protein AAF492_25745, partial [Verrucomicrobiota bacterium]